MNFTKKILICFSIIFLLSSCDLKKHIESRKLFFTDTKITFERVGLEGFQFSNNLKTLKSIDFNIFFKIKNNSNKTVVLDQFDIGVFLDNYPISKLTGFKTILIKAKQTENHVIRASVYLLPLDKLIKTNNIKINGVVNTKITLFDEVLIDALPIKINQSISVEEIKNKIKF